jgi:hypothetical protein
MQLWLVLFTTLVSDHHHRRHRDHLLVGTVPPSDGAISVNISANEK